MDVARKNLTQKYMRLYRLALRLLNPTMFNQEDFGRIHGLLSRAATSIQSIMKIYREPAFQFFVDFLREEVVTEDRFPKFIMALPLRPA